jgi:serine/threonine-protein kinase
MSPEQVRGGLNLDHRTDIYSLGVLMYYVFTGVEPFTGDTPNAIIYKQLNENPIPPCQVNPNLPPWVEMIILKSMIKNPNGRYQRAAHIARDFIHYLK